MPNVIQSSAATITHPSTVQTQVSQLLRLLGISVTCGQVTLNLNEGRLQSFTTTVHQRVQSEVQASR